MKKQNFFLPERKMPTLKELKQKARSAGIIGFSRMNKAELEKLFSQTAVQKNIFSCCDNFHEKSSSPKSLNIC